MQLNLDISWEFLLEYYFECQLSLNLRYVFLYQHIQFRFLWIKNYCLYLFYQDGIGIYQLALKKFYFSLFYIYFIYLLPNISQSKCNQTLKFDQLIEYNKINIFKGGRLVPDLFFLFFKKTLYKVKGSGLQISFNIFQKPSA